MFISSKCSLFHNSKLFGSCNIHILYTECAKIKKNNSSSKRLKVIWCSSVLDVGLDVFAFEGVGCCMSMGDVGCASLLLLRGGGLISNGLTL